MSESQFSLGCSGCTQGRAVCPTARDSLVWGMGPSSEWLQEAQQDWDCKAANSCRVLLAGSAHSLVPCSELIIR